MAKGINQLIKNYRLKRDDIKRRLDDFKEVLKQSDERVFAELAFCICTPQSKATAAWNSITTLVKNDYLFSGSENVIRPFLNAVRFCENKSKYIVEARNFFTKNNKLQIKEKIKSFDDQFKLREWLEENIKGFGMKESSHFIRNIGLGNEMAILDVHILKNLKEYGVIEEVLEALTKKNYLDIEGKMREFSKLVKIPMDELDLLLWSEETGMIFK
jgi:N-glycosylase/DNA lyase